MPCELVIFLGQAKSFVPAHFCCGVGLVAHKKKGFPLFFLGRFLCVFMVCPFFFEGDFFFNFYFAPYFSIFNIFFDFFVRPFFCKKKRGVFLPPFFPLLFFSPSFHIAYYVIGDIKP